MSEDKLRKRIDGHDADLENLYQVMNAIVAALKAKEIAVEGITDEDLEMISTPQDIEDAEKMQQPASSSPVGMAEAPATGTLTESQKEMMRASLQKQLAALNR